MFAVRLSGLTAAASILKTTNRFEMVRIYTAPNAAQMVQGKPIWDFSLKQSIRQSMGAVVLHAAVYAGGDSGVTASIYNAVP